MQRTCAQTGVSFEVSAAELEYCREHAIPLPTLCPEVRLRRIVSFRNRSFLYTSKCALTGKSMFSCIPPTSGLTVYDVDAWNSDTWDWRTLGRPYDFTRPFFAQFAELHNIAPLPNLAVLRSTMENSDYTNGIAGAKNCYLVFAASYNEDCMFSKFINYSRNLVDCIYCDKCELCYDCKDCHECYNLKCSESCHNCFDSAFLLNCQGCNHCYGCVNIAQKQYHFFNERLSKDEYERRIAELDLGSFATIEREKVRFSGFSAQFGRKYYSGRMNEQSSGNFLNNNRNARQCYFVNDCEDVAHCVWLYGVKKSFFYFAYGKESELIYNCGSVGDQAYNLKFCFECWPGAHDLEYCMLTCYGSHDCFGCVSVKKASYCILNQQYTKEEYFDLLPRIKSHMRSTGEYGQFFPASLAHYPFNRSDANDFYPLSQAQARKLGFRWEPDEVAPTTPAFLDIPDHIRDVPDDILTKTLTSSRSAKKFKIIAKELEFYRAANLPLPRVAPLDRLRACSSLLAIHPLRSASCSRCQAPLDSSYTSRVAQLYCEPCYQEVLTG